MYVYCSAGIMKTVSILPVEALVHQRHLELELDSPRSARSPRTITLCTAFTFERSPPAVRGTVSTSTLRKVRRTPRVRFPCRSDDREERLLLLTFTRMATTIRSKSRAPRSDNVDVPVGQRIERAGIDGDTLAVPAIVTLRHHHHASRRPPRRTSRRCPLTSPAGVARADPPSRASRRDGRAR